MGKKSRQKRAKRGGEQTYVPWTTFVQADSATSPVLDDVTVARFMEGTILFVNSRYHVHIRRRPSTITEAGYVMELSIRNNDRSARRDWRDFQRIKNELLGPEWEAAELYPAEERLVDSANQFYLFCVPPPYRFPFGFQERLVAEGGGGGAIQRIWADGKPADCKRFT